MLAWLPFLLTLVFLIAYFTVIRVSDESGLMKKSCVIEYLLFAVALIATLSAWIYTNEVGDLIFLSLCSAGSLTLLLSFIVKQRSPNRWEWWFLVGILL
jgi:hypothetical protein